MAAIVDRNTPVFVGDPVLQDILLGIYERLGKVEIQVDTVGDHVEDLINTVRGHNGTPGLVTEVCLLKEAVNTAKKDVSDAAKKEPSSKENVTFAWIVDRLVAPVMTAIITSVILYFLLKGG